MKTFQCNCGGAAFFENSVCLRCGRDLGFCPECRQITTLIAAGDDLYRCGRQQCQARLRKCGNYSEHNVCNRCVRSESAATLCDCCVFNATIPDLSVAKHYKKWGRLEAAKRRLFYDLDALGLTRFCYDRSGQRLLRFDFKADRLPVHPLWRPADQGERVFTGHAGGLITINIREADDAERERMRVQLKEPQRTLIGHFRHEIGHFYWDRLVKGQGEAAFVAAFGDHNSTDYGEALERHYAEGPPADWQTRFISAYATMHPWEDFAETWAAYLDVVSVLDTAANNGLGADPKALPFDERILAYQRLGLAWNELNRSLGLIDAVPEVFVPAVIEKLRYVHDLLAGVARR